MADFNALHALINAYIKKNGVKAITGQILNGVLSGMVNALGKGFTVAGAATPETDPGTMTGPLAYIAYTAGTYPHFGGLVVEQGEVAMFMFNENEWTKDVLFSLAATASVDDTVGTPSVGVSFVDGLLTFDFHNLKGETGEPAGFGHVTATVDANIGTPSVTVQESGPDTAKNYTFAFRNLKGETGVTSVVATVDNTIGTPSCAVSLNGQELHLDFHGLKGMQGDTGVSADYPIAIVNNLTTSDPASALSAQMGVQLESEVSQLEAKVTDFESPSFTPSAGYVAVDGTIVPNYSGYTYTTPIPLQKGWLFTFEVYGGSGIAYLTKQKNGVNTPIYTTNNHPTKKFVYFADEDCDVILCSQKANTNDYGYYNVLVNKNEVLYNHGERITDLENKVDGFDVNLDTNNTTQNYYRAKSGGIASLSGFFYSNPIPVNKGDKFTANSVSGNSAQTTIAMLSWVDASNNFVSLILNPNGAGTYEYTFPHDGFACVSGNASDMAKFGIHCGGALFEIGELKNEVEPINESIEDIENTIDGELIVLTSDDITSGSYRGQGGGIAPLSGFFYSNPIQVGIGDKFVADSVSANSAQSVIAMLSWVDENNNFISKILNPEGAGSYEYTFKKSGYVSISGNEGDLAKFSVETHGISGTISIIEDNILGRVESLSSDDVTENKYRSYTGGVASLTNFFYSNPIKVNGGDKFKAVSVSVNSAQSAVAMLSWVDEENGFISLILNPNGAGSYEYSFNKSWFVSISGHIMDLGKFSVEIGGIDTHITNLSERVEELESGEGYDSIRLPKLTDNPVEKIDFNCGLVGIFKTIGVIGDSLASGEMQGYHEDGTLYYRDMYELSWGQQIAKMTGVEVFNFSQGGQYAKGWMNGNTERTWDASGTHNGASVNLRQCYFIGFAHNDKTMVDNNTYSAGIGTTADINDSDYTQNADSYVGWYARIIQAVKSVEPRAFIFCITPPSSLYDSYSAQIRDIVTHFSGNRVYLIDLRQYGMAWSSALFSMGNHLSSAGYLYHAYEIANYVDWIIRNNPEDFKFASLVGTDILDTNPNP